MVILDSISRDIVLSNSGRHVVEAWSDWNDTAWRTLSDWSGFRIFSVFRTAFLVLVFCTSIYFSTTNTDELSKTVHERSRVSVLSFVLVFSATITLAFKSIIFSGHNSSGRLLMGMITILTTALSVAGALPARPHLAFMAKGLWCAIALVVVALGLNYLMLIL